LYIIAAPTYKKSSNNFEKETESAIIDYIIYQVKKSLEIKPLISQWIENRNKEKINE
jgi:hypothetical protein